MTAPAVVPFDPHSAKLPAVEASLEKLDLGKYAPLPDETFRAIICDWWAEERKSESMDGYVLGAIATIEAGVEFTSYNGVRYRRARRVRS